MSSVDHAIGRLQNAVNPAELVVVVYALQRTRPTVAVDARAHVFVRDRGSARQSTSTARNTSDDEDEVLRRATLDVRQHLLLLLLLGKDRCGHTGACVSVPAMRLVRLRAERETLIR